MAQLDKFKLTALTWDSDKDPNGFVEFMNTLSSLVRATEHGPPLEDFLDHKLDRCRMMRVIIPSFIVEDEDFRVDPEPSPRRHAEVASDGEEDAQDFGTAETKSRSGTASAFVLKSAPTPLRAMTAQTRALDQMLYNVLKMNVKGSKAALLQCVQAPSYVQGI